MEIKLVTLNSTPVFTIQDESPRWSRVYGAKYDKRKKRWIIPAFPPFLNLALHDIAQVYSDVTFDATANRWIKEQKTWGDWEKIVKNTKFPIKSYAHQEEGLTDILFNHRWILKYEMGTGKTKIVVDQVSVLGLKTLVLCPLIGLDNWVKETEFHSGGKLSAIAIKGGSKKQKMRKLAECLEYDVTVVTYDTARIYGVPQLFPKAIKEFIKGNVAPRSEIKAIIKQVNDEKEQVRLVRAWQSGMKPKELRQSVDNFIDGTVQWLSQTKFKEIVIDESHRIKDISSLRTKEVLKLSKCATRRVCLTGTLSHGDPRDLYPQLRFLAPYILPWDYKKYCDNHLVTASNNEHMIVGYKDIHILNRLVSRNSSEKLLDDCVDLPERSFEVIKFDLSPGQRRDYNRVVQSWTLDRPDADPLEIQNGAIRISKLLQLCSGFVYVPEDEGICDHCSQTIIKNCVMHSIRPGTSGCYRKDEIGPVGRRALKYPDNPKIAVLKDMCEDIVDTHKAIIWAVMTEELDDIEKMAKKNKWGYVRVDGKTSKNVSTLADRFNNNPKCRLYIAQISTGIMITLNAAKYAIYYSRDWSVDHRYQSLFRNYRIGQKQKTMVYDLCAAHTLELQQLKALVSKEEVASLMTKKINCTLCRKYAECTKNNIQPWESDCVLNTTASRVIAKARTI